MNMMRKIIVSVLIVISLSCFVFTGCQVMKNADGSTSIRLNPLVADKIEAGAEGGKGMAEALTPLIGPAGGIIAGGLGAFLTLFKKYKGPLTEYKSKAEMSHTVATISVDTIEQIKKEYPEVWDKMSDEVRRMCENADLDTKEIKNFIRGLRGLPAQV